MPCGFTKRTSLIKRVSLYPLALELNRSRGWDHNRIATELGLSISTVYNWLHGLNSPYGSCTKPDLSRSASLGYLAGAFVGDGAAIKSSEFHYELRLRVRDHQFAEDVATCASAIIQKSKRPKLDKRGFFVVRFWSRLLYEFLSDWQRIRGTADIFPREFIRGFADAEGTPAVSIYTRLGQNAHEITRELGFYIVLVNTKEWLLEYIRQLLLECTPRFFANVSAHKCGASFRVTASPYRPA